MAVSTNISNDINPEKSILRTIPNHQIVSEMLKDSTLLASFTLGNVVN